MLQIKLSTSYLSLSLVDRWGTKDDRDEVVVGWLLNVPVNMLVYLRDGFAQLLRAATLR